MERYCLERMGPWWGSDKVGCGGEETRFGASTTPAVLPRNSQSRGIFTPTMADKVLTVVTQLGLSKSKTQPGLEMSTGSRPGISHSFINDMKGKIEVT